MSELGLEKRRGESIKAWAPHCDYPWVSENDLKQKKLKYAILKNFLKINSW